MICIKSLEWVKKHQRSGLAEEKREKQKCQEDIDIKSWRSLRGETGCGRVDVMGEMDSCLDFCSCNKPKILGR